MSYINISIQKLKTCWIQRKKNFNENDRFTDSHISCNWSGLGNRNVFSDKEAFTCTCHVPPCIRNRLVRFGDCIYDDAQFIAKTELWICRIYFGKLFWVGLLWNRRLHFWENIWTSLPRPIKWLLQSITVHAANTACTGQLGVCGFFRLRVYTVPKLSPRPPQRKR